MYGASNFKTTTIHKLTNHRPNCILYAECLWCPVLPGCEWKRESTFNFTYINTTTCKLAPTPAHARLGARSGEEAS